MRLLRWVCLGALWLTVWAPRLLGYEVTLELGRGVNLVAVPMEYESLVPVFTASDLARQTRSAIVARGVERDFGAPRFYTFLPSAGGFDFMVRPGSGLIVVSSMSQTVRLSVPEPVFPGRIETIAGTGAAGYSGDGGPATQAQLYIPTHLSLDSAGNIYILDAWNSAIRRVDARTGLISTIAGGRKVRDRNGAPIPTGDGGPAVDATFDCLFSIHVDPTDKLWITGCDTYRRIDLRTGLIDAPFQRLSFGRDVVVTADGTLYHSSDDPGGLYVTHPAGRTEMLLSWPDCQIQGGNERRLYFAQLGGDTLYEFDLGTRKVRHLVGRGYSDLGLDGQAPRDTGFFGRTAAQATRPRSPGTATSIGPADSGKGDTAGTAGPRRWPVSMGPPVPAWSPTGRCCLPTAATTACGAFRPGPSRRRRDRNTRSI
ncbi:MAG: hypothetical protein HY814_03530 [Candidatus Riflebacteria bacterium]|nr:hypothetical protein [Candidatus Riflebacteria bacterium]